MEWPVYIADVCRRRGTSSCTTSGRQGGRAGDGGQTEEGGRRLFSAYRDHACFARSDLIRREGCSAGSPAKFGGQKARQVPVRTTCIGQPMSAR